MYLSERITRGKVGLSEQLRVKSLKELSFDFNRTVNNIISESNFKMNAKTLNLVFENNPVAENINVKFTPEIYDGFNLEFIKHFRGVAEDIKTINENNDGIKKLHEMNEILIEYENVIRKENAFHKCYVPVLRGSYPLDGEEENKKDYYFDRINEIYRLNAKPFNTQKLNNKELQIFSGKSIYSNFKTMLLGSPANRDLAKKYQEFLSNTFFQGREVTLIPNQESKGYLELMIEGDEQRRIYDVGDGLGQMIILTFPIFMREEPSMFFIEEPDLFMHPGMQRVLMEAMLMNVQHQYFITTHSNHILDLAVERPQDYSIFMLKKKGINDFEVKNINKGLREINKDLGVRNTSVLLANASIWVEGVTDKLYLKSFLKKYLETLKLEDEDLYIKYSRYIEDYHYIFVEYQGSNLPHFNFGVDDDNQKTTNVNSLIGNALVIADGDVKNKGNRILTLENALGKDGVTCLECKEIENLIPLPILKEAAKQKFSSSNLDKKGVIFDPSKLRAQSYMKSKNYGVGKFLDDCLSQEKDYFSEPPAKTKNEKTGSLKNKTEFCEAVVAIMEKGDIEFTLNKQLRDLCLQIFKHIEKCNNNDCL